MPVKKYKPTSPGRRHGSVLDFSELSKVAPEKSLLRPLKKTGGRNNRGRITARRRGGGHKRRYRVIDFRRDHDGVPAVVKTLEYDPNRSARIALLHYADGRKAYMLAPVGLKVGQKIESGEKAEPTPGNAMKLRDIPLGLQIHGGRVTVLAVEHLGQQGGLAQMAGALAHDQREMPVAHVTADDVIAAVQQAHGADGRGRQDRRAVGFIVKRHVARHDGHIQRRTGRADALDGAHKLPHDLGLFGVAEIQVVG